MALTFAEPVAESSSVSFSMDAFTSGVRVKEKRSRAKDGPNADPMKEMRDRYERAVEAERDNRLKGIDDHKVCLRSRGISGMTRNARRVAIGLL